MRDVFYAGGDWSGRPESDDLLVFCVAALGDLEAWNETCRDLRQRFGMAQEQEFHGHEMRPEQMLELLSAARRLDMRVGALLIDNAPVSGEVRTALQHAPLALALLRRLLPLCPLQKLWYDEEIKGKKAEQAFNTEVQRIQRMVHADTKISAKARRSHTSNLVQLADVIAYALAKQARRTLKHSLLEQYLRELRADERNLIIGPMRWEEV